MNHKDTLRSRRLSKVRWTESPKIAALLLSTLFGLGLCEPLAYGAASEDTRERADALLKAGSPRVLTSDPAEVLPSLREALEIYSRLEKPQGQADALFLLGLAELKRGRGDEAKAFLEEGARLRTDLGDHFGVWMSEWMMSELDRRAERYEQALARLEEGLAVLEAFEKDSGPWNFGFIQLMVSMAGLPLGQGIDLSFFGTFLKPLLLERARPQTHSSLGRLLAEAGRFEEAEKHFERALAGGADLGQEEILFRFGQLRRRQMLLGEARALLQRALSAAERSGIGAVGALISGSMLSFGEHIEAFTKTRILSELAKVEMLDGRYEEALATNSRAIEASALEGPERTISLLDERGLLLTSLGRFIEAEKALAEMEEVGRKGKVPSIQGDIFQSRASLYLMQGRHQEAIFYQEKAVQILKKTAKPYPYAASLLCMLQMYQVLDMKDRAWGTLQEIDKVIPGLDFPGAEHLRTYLQHLVEHGDQDNWLEQVSESLSFMLEVARSDSTLPALQVLDPLVKLWSDLDRFEELEPELLKARELAKNSNLVLHQSLIDLWLALGYSTSGASPKAEQFLTDALLVLKNNYNKDVALVSGLAAGSLAFHRGNQATAREAVKRAVEQLDDLVGEIHSEELLTTYMGSSRQLLFRMAVKGMAQIGDSREAFSIAEKIRARSLLGLLGGQRFKAPEGPATEIVHQADAVRQRIIELESGDSLLLRRKDLKRAAELVAARRKYQDLMLRAKLLSPEYRELVSVQDPLSIEEIQQKALPPETSLVSFFATGQGVLAWVIDSSSFEMVETTMTAKDLKAVPCFLQSLARRGGSLTSLRGEQPTKARTAQSAASTDNCGEPELSLESLYSKLIAPLRLYLRYSRLIIVPHDTLHYLAFAALKSPGPQGRYLVEEFTLSYAPSASVLPYLAKKKTTIHGQALVMGAPTREDLAPLRGAELEGQIVAEIFGTKALLKDDATEVRLHRDGARADVIHLAAHAFFNSEQPRFSRVALAASKPIQTGRDDGNLEVHEIFGELDLEGVNLVTLSACQTSLGRRTAGDEIIGMTRGFFYAGVPTVVSTLWNIDDRASISLVEAFYRHWKKGLPVAEALRAAQLQQLSRKDTADPYYWAAFGLYGDPSSLWPVGLADDSEAAEATPAAADRRGEPDRCPPESQRSRREILGHSP